MPTAKIGTFDTELVREFFQALATHGGITLHVDKLHGFNSHHIAEAAFKAVARALREAVEPDPRTRGCHPLDQGHALTAMRTVIVDYESGNLHSAEKAFQRMADETGAGQVIVTSDPDAVRRADRIVLPGDGAFPACRKELFDHRGLFEAMEEAVIRDARPFLGICVGMQMLATRGLEYTPPPASTGSAARWCGSPLPIPR